MLSGSAAVWHLTEAQLRARGHQTIAPDLLAGMIPVPGESPGEVPGCHCAALSHPRELANLLVSYLD